MKPAGKNFWTNLSLAVLSALVFLAAAELFLRFTGVYERLMGRYAVQAFQSNNVELAVHYGTFLWDNLLFWRMNPGSSGVNGQGFREARDIPAAKPAGTFRVVCIGDSVPFGYGLPAEKAYPRLLEEMLRSRTAKNVEVINAGVVGYTSWQALRYLERDLIKYAPDLVIHYSGPNDENDSVGLSDKEQPVPPRWLARAHSYLSTFKTYSLLASCLYNLKYRTGKAGAARQPRVSREDYARNIRSMAELGKEHGFETVFIRPVFYSQDIRAVKELYPLPEGVRVVDQVFNVIKARENEAQRFFLKNDCAHFSEEGHRLVAGALADLIMEKGLLN